MVEPSGTIERQRLVRAARFSASIASRALAPDAVADLLLAVEFAEQAVAADPDNNMYRNTLGAILHRAGRHQKAADVLTELTEAWESGEEPIRSSPAYTWYFLAMTHQRLGNFDRARMWLRKANAQSESELTDDSNPPPWNRRLTLQLLRAEAEQRIDASDQA